MVVVWDYDWSIVQRMNEWMSWETTTPREKLRYRQAKMHIAYTIIKQGQWHECWCAI